MAHLFRLIACALALVVSFSAQALVPKATQYSASNGGNLIAGVGPWSTFSAACEGGRAWIAGIAPSRTYRVSVSTAPTCLVEQQTSAGGAWTATQIGVVASSNACPAHSVASGTACKCDTGYEERDGQCKTPGSVCVDKATQDAIPPGVTQEFNATKAAAGGMFVPRKVCIDSCQASGTPSYWACGGTNCTVHFEKAAFTGQPCSGDGAGTAPESDTKPTPPAERCPDGKVPGTFQGSNVCVTPGEAGSAASTSGSTTNTGTNPDGTAAPGTSSGTGSTSQTSCNGTTCTTTTTTNSTTTNGSGQTSTAGETTTKSEPQASHCASNPKAKECAGNEPTQSSFSGACEGGFVAKGDDAVLNAMAKEQYTRNCQVLTLTSAEATVVANASDATGLQKVTTAGDSSVAISSGNFDTSNSLGGGGCSLNKTITVAHMTATLPFNVICDPLAYLGQVLVAVSLLLAARIVARG